MSFSRSENFSVRETQFALWCKALAHPARIVILKTLADRKECICGDLVIDLPLAQSTVSQHLKVLKEAELIQGEIDGPRSKYCVNKKNFQKFMKMFIEFNGQVNGKLIKQKC